MLVMMSSPVQYRSVSQSWVFCLSVFSSVAGSVVLSLLQATHSTNSCLLVELVTEIAGRLKRKRSVISDINNSTSSHHGRLDTARWSVCTAVVVAAVMWCGDDNVCVPVTRCRTGSWANTLPRVRGECCYMSWLTLALLTGDTLQSEHYKLCRNEDLDYTAEPLQCCSQGPAAAAASQ